MKASTNPRPVERRISPCVAEYAAAELQRVKASNKELLAALRYLETSTQAFGQWDKPEVCRFVRAAINKAQP